MESSPLYKITEEVAGCRFAIAAPLFLFLKAKFADGIEHKLDQEFIDYTKKVGGFECSIAIYLLGLSLGYDKTYDSFYESAELPFFKIVIQSRLPSFSDNNNSDFQEQLPIIWMRNKKRDVRPAFNEEEKSKLVSLGYEAVKRFNDTVMKAIARMNFDPEKEKRRFSTSKSQRNK